MTLEWKTDESESVTVFEANVTGASDRAIDESAAAIWRLFQQEVLPRHERSDWHVVRLEFWPDSGRSILFPAKKPFRDRTEKAMVDVCWSGLLQLWETLEADESISERTFDKRIRTHVETLLRGFRNTFDKTALASAVRVDCFLYEKRIDSFGPNSAKR